MLRNYIFQVNSWGVCNSCLFISFELGLQPVDLLLFILFLLLILGLLIIMLSLVLNLLIFVNIIIKVRYNTLICYNLLFLWLLLLFFMPPCLRYNLINLFFNCRHVLCHAILFSLLPFTNLQKLILRLLLYLLSNTLHVFFIFLVLLFVDLARILEIDFFGYCHQWLPQLYRFILLEWHKLRLCHQRLPEILLHKYNTK